MKYLLVGGPRHGEFIDIPDNRRIFLVPVMQPISAASWATGGNEYQYTPSLPVCEYERADVGSDRLVYIAKRVSPR